MGGKITPRFQEPVEKYFFARYPTITPQDALFTPNLPQHPLGVFLPQTYPKLAFFIHLPTEPWRHNLQDQNFSI